MNPFGTILNSAAQFGVIAIALFGGATPMAAENSRTPVNEFGAPVRDRNGVAITYSREEVAAMAEKAASVSNKTEPQLPGEPKGFVPPSGAARPFWQYSIFGSGIGGSNIIIGPAAGSGEREIIIGGNSTSNFGGDDFWQVLLRNSATGNYDQLFVSPLFTAAIKRMATANVMGDSQKELAVMLADGRVYLYDLATKAELGHITTGVSGLEGLSLTDLDGDGTAEVIVTTANDLFVFSGAGVLLWQLAGAGGYDVVAGQMDLDPALEIAGTNGVVTDTATHLAQWTRNGGFGSYLRLAPLAGASYQQLVAAQGWDFVYAYDVATQLPRWSISVFDIDAIEIADVDNDGTPELIIGDGQWGTVHVHDLNTQAQKWETNNPEHGVTNIAVGDVDNDGEVDLLWGAGWTSTGADYLYVASITGTHAIKWRSPDLLGPFIGPIIGDLDGDGRPELVVSSYAYSGGRIMVFDMGTMALRAISAPILGGFSAGSDLKLRDVDGDGRLDIVVAGAQGYDGSAEIYGFDSSNTFTLKWTNTTRPFGNPFSFVEVADLDGNGTAEIIAGNSVAHTGSDGVYVYIFDYPAAANPWRSVSLASNFNSVKGLVVADLDGNGGKDIAALVSTGDLYTFEGPTRQLKDLKQGTAGAL